MSLTLFYHMQQKMQTTYQMDSYSTTEDNIQFTRYN